MVDMMALESAEARPFESETTAKNKQSTLRNIKGITVRLDLDIFPPWKK
jgi:hypothetical protein